MAKVKQSKKARQSSLPTFPAQTHGESTCYPNEDGAQPHATPLQEEESGPSQEERAYASVPSTSTGVTFVAASIIDEGQISQ